MDDRDVISRVRTATLSILVWMLLATVTIGQSVRIFEVGAEAKLLLKQGAGEGPAWHADYGLFFSGSNGITLYSRNGTSRVFLKNAGSNGLLLDASGRLLICQPASRRVARMDLASRELEVLVSGYRGHKFNQPNDITVDSQGRIYFSDPRYGDRENMELVDNNGRKIEGVYRIDKDGTVTRIITHDVDRPNGVVVSADDRYLFVADNNNNEVGGARKLWRFDLRSDGTVNTDSRKMLFDWKTGRGPDGMVMDQKGRLYVAGGRHRANLPFETAKKFKAGVYVFRPDGKQVGFVEIPRDEVTNCTFGGADLKTLFITAGGTLWSIRTTTSGRMPWTKN
jgi:gluconolactonase